MSRLRRLRSWWLSLYLPRRPASQTKRHRDLFKSQEDYYEWRDRHRPPTHSPEVLAKITADLYRCRLEAGMWERSASTGTRALGTQTPETVTSAGCSSSSRPGEASADEAGLTLYRLPSSYTEPSLSGDGTVGLGGSGARDGSAG